MKNIVIVSHCILNNHSKIKRYDNITREIDISTRKFIEFLLDEEIGIVQMPCPESHCYGLNRWGHTKNQFNHPHYRSECRELFHPILNQLINYENTGYNVLAIIGMYGSPTCGVENTCIGDWGGEISANPNLRRMVNEIKKSKESGIFIEEIKEILDDNGLNIPILEYNRRHMDTLMRNIVNLKLEEKENKMLEII